ncbi:MAG: LysR substrate-binding domain-containing protein [Alphaproteobacteria bacterium]|nr:LysR substrate-binding domain-containing protein [Alphaproteobacteria bacterium]MCD8570491.1 LysR substrate-binding domain-containing protein [Alphaproteobacteria bacterium]
MDNLSRIGIFVEVARQESFAAAARELGITSSAVSKQVQNLEYDLKTKLLNRTTRKVSLTEEGALFFERSRRALEDLKEAADQMNELKATPRGTLKVSVPMALGVKYLKEPIAEFARLYPDVHLDIQFDDRLINIAEEGFDLVIRIGVLSDSSMIARKLAPAPAHVCGCPNYFKKYGIPKTPEELAEHNVLAYTRNKGAHEWRYKGPDGVEGLVGLKSTFKCDAADMMLAAACEGIGLIISPIFFVKEELESGKLVSVLNDYTMWPERNLYAIFPPNRYLSTRLRLFVDHLDRYCSQKFSDV